jgi:hypothetical protein
MPRFVPIAVAKSYAIVEFPHQGITPPLAAVSNLLLLSLYLPEKVVTSNCAPPTVTTKAWAEPGLRLMAARAAAAPRASLRENAENESFKVF